MAKGIRDFMDITGLGRDAVKQAMRNGQLPGSQVGRFFVCPDEAFLRYTRGDWTPPPRQLTPITPLVRKVRRSND